jgi:hypothetical protein
VSAQQGQGSAVHLEMQLANLPDLIRSADVKICLLEVVHKAVLELPDKLVMDLILAEHVLHRWIASNLGCVREFLSQIFQKMSQVKS